MPIVCFKDNKNNTWKRNAKTKQKKQLSKKKKKNRTRGMEATAKGWEINDFVERLSLVFSN